MSEKDNVVLFSTGDGDTATKLMRNGNTDFEFVTVKLVYVHHVPLLNRFISELKRYNAEVLLDSSPCGVYIDSVDGADDIVIRLYGIESDEYIRFSKLYLADDKRYYVSDSHESEYLEGALSDLSDFIYKYFNY